MYNYVMNINGALRPYSNAPNDYQTDVIAGRAVDYIIRTAQAGESPFFLLVAPTAPHVEVFPSPTTIDEYQDSWKWSIRPAPRHVDSVLFPLPNPLSFNEEDVADKPAWIQSKPNMTPEDWQFATRQYRDRLASLRAVDNLIQRVIVALGQVGELRNTVLLFTSDNGWLYGEHRLSAKLAAFEEAIRVPLFIRSGNPSTVNALVTNIDLAPTILDLAGVPMPTSVDGKSVVPLLTDPSLPWRKRFLVESWEVVGQPGEPLPFEVPTFNAIRTGPDEPDVPNMTLVAYQDGGGEFYDLAIDLPQMDSLHLDTTPLRVQQRSVLTKWLQGLARCGDGSCQELEFK
jgi:arylsulfatase A-like enzyme